MHLPEKTEFKFWIECWQKLSGAMACAKEKQGVVDRRLKANDFATVQALLKHLRIPTSEPVLVNRSAKEQRIF